MIKKDVYSLQSNESRQIYHLQFTSWPDYGTPSSAAAFLEFLFKVRACQEEAVSSLGSEWQGHALGPPIVVHCSAGIGRTGQDYCLIFVMYKRNTVVLFIFVVCNFHKFFKKS